MKPFFFLLILILVPFGAKAGTAGQSSDSALTPEQVVALFRDTYGTARMDEIGPHTTAKFRQDRPISAWVVEEWEDLYDMGYEKLAFKIVESTVDQGNGRASVAANAKIRDEEGVVDQREIYMLILEGSIWKIDELYVVDQATIEDNQAL